MQTHHKICQSFCRWAIISLVLLTLVCGFLLNIAVSSQEKIVQQIETDRVIQGVIPPSSGRHYEFDIHLVKGQFLSVVATSQQVLSDLEARTVDGAPLAGDGGFAAPSNLAVSMVVPETATYRIHVYAGPKGAEFKLLVTIPQQPTPEFFLRAKAQELQQELGRLHYNKKRNREAYLKMTDVGEEVVQLWGQLGRPNLQLDALMLMAEARRQLGEWTKAIEMFERTLEISRALRFHFKEAESLTFIGMCHFQLSDYRRAIEAYHQASQVWDLEIAHGKCPYNMAGWTLVQLGNAQLALGEWKQAHETFQRAADLYTRYRDYSPTVVSQREWHKGTAFCLRGIGRAYSLTSEKQKAIDALTEALEHYKGAEDNFYEPVLLNELGELYASLGESGQAQGFYEQALKLEQRMGNRSTEAQTLYLVGRLFQAMGNLEGAEQQFHLSSELRRDLGDRRGLAASLNGLGEIRAARGERGQAISLFETSLAILREIGDRFGEAGTLGNLGTAHAAMGDETRAKDFLNQSLSVRRALNDREGEANALYHLARLALQHGRLDEARQLAESSLKQTEFIRGSVLSQELRASYLGTVRDYYELYIDVLMRLHQQRPKEGHDRAALHASEMARARSLLDSLAEARIDIRSDAPADLLARERELRQRLSAKAEAQVQSQTQSGSDALAKDIQAITTEYRQTLSKLRAVSPRYAALIQPQSLAASEVQQLLDQETMLLEYSLGEERSFLWAVTRDGVTSYALPSRNRINAAAQRVYDLLTARNRRQSQENSTQRQTRIAQADAALPQAAAELSRLILSPVAARLGNQRLLIVAQETLQFIPFAILPKPVGVRQQMIFEHEISYLPSASVLASLRRESSARQIAPKQLAVIADPVFSANDERVTSRAIGSPEIVFVNSALPGSLFDLRQSQSASNAREVFGGAFDGRIPRLDGTRWEADQISSLVNAASRLQATGFAANRALVVGDELQRYRIVHFATHALVNNSHAELSGVVLSLVDDRGRPQNGFVSAADIYNLRLAADLVVLSGCQTGLGKAVRGEGLVGMTQSFMYAGASRVVVSLWAQQDKSTADLMNKFYRRLLGAKAARPSEALRAAQIEMIKSGRWPLPYFWSGFTLQGEYR